MFTLFHLYYNIEHVCTVLRKEYMIFFYILKCYLQFTVPTVVVNYLRRISKFYALRVKCFIRGITF